MKTQILLAVLAGSAASLFAQEPPSPGGEKGHRPPPPPPSPILVALDTNKDGVISAAELSTASASLKALDKNGDGQLTKDEFCPKPPPRPQSRNESKKDSTQHRPPPPSPLVGALDADKDRVISATELAGASTALATLDKNADGQLTREEFAPPPPRRQHHGMSDSNKDSDSSPE